MSNDHRKIYHLEGVRGAGAVLVYLCHFQILFTPGAYNRIYHFFSAFLSDSVAGFLVHIVDLNNVGVICLHIFWILSGYVIFRHPFSGYINSNILSSFVVKRYIRLMVPCAVSVFFSYYIYLYGFVYVNELGIETKQENLYALPPSFLHALETSLWSNLFDYDYGHSYNGPLWTIQKEFYGSVFSFGLFSLTAYSGKRTWYYIMVFFCVFSLKLYWLNSFLFGYILSDYSFAKDRVFRKSFFINKISYSVLINNSWMLLAMFVVVFLSGEYLVYKYQDLYDPVFSVLGFGLIFLFMKIKPLIVLMQSRIFTWLGRMSLGIYVLHWPLCCSLSSWMYIYYNMRSPLLVLLLLAITTAVLLLMSVIFYRWVDQKSIKWSAIVALYLQGGAGLPSLRLIKKNGLLERSLKRVF